MKPDNLTTPPDVMSLLNDIEMRQHGEGRSMIVLHGLQSTMDVWNNVIQRLEGWRVVMLNMPGRGQSKRWNKSDGPIENFYSVERYTDTLFALIQRIGEPVTLAGWSMGAIVALRYAQKYGLDAVDQLILLSGVAKVDGNCSSFRGRTVSEVVIEAQNRSEAAGMFNVADPIAVAHTWFSLQHLDFRGTLSSIDKPTVVIHGTNDAECPASQGKFMAERIPSAVWVPLEQIDHFVLKLAPEEIVMAIQNNRCSH